ncbi:MAG: isoprenylcysteine carboxylmethyltransferase family protein, partial [Pseudomonadota bacterium]
IARAYSGLNVQFPGQGVLAGALIVIGLTIELTSVAAFFRRKTTVNPLAPGKASALVVDGFYRFTRNPMYLGMLILLSGWAVHLGSFINVFIAALFVVALTHLQIKPEERALSKRFGEDYEAYRKRVRRWL